MKQTEAERERSKKYMCKWRVIEQRAAAMIRNRHPEAIGRLSNPHSCRSMFPYEWHLCLVKAKLECGLLDGKGSNGRTPDEYARWVMRGLRDTESLVEAMRDGGEI